MRTQASTSELRQTDVAPRIGTVIETDVDTLLSGALAQDIRALLEQRGVIVFPRIGLTDEQQVAFTRTLGRIVEEGEGGIYKVTIDPLENPNAEFIKGAFYWHIDGTTADVPILASVMSARRLSPVGGDTLFANTYAAFDDLPPQEQEEFDQLRVVHMFETAQRYVRPEPSYDELRAWQRFEPNVLPLVWKHRSGRKSLVLGSTASHVEGMDLREGQALLTRLRDHATQDRFVYRHRWSVGDMVIWDNTGTMHKAEAYPADSGRMMHRTKLEGEEPFA
ncbi:TauD/TfdA family dioxygenase [Blastococcus sp. URHD0036]|uniref:TauD/TfdA dioxygenase family protein n=1 Tax=Blastococcus sp. URHD0036 TaxID=1380356 RepID=UPI0004971389|nr:TauD/TfdA family dioxygenase [Blastococcus sp. URHD0036]